MANETKKDAAPVPGVMLGLKIEIFPTLPLPEFNTPGGLAYTARYKTESSSELVAIVCLSVQPPRIDVAAILHKIDNPGILPFIESGVIPWASGSNAYAFVYQKPLSPAMMTNIDETRTLLSEEIVNHQFITPMVGALVALANGGIVHNAIRPTNIFWRLGNVSPPQIGDCLSCPAGLGQPAMFEPIERALCMPQGRGTGIRADDCYAFGMVLALLVLGRNPLQGMDDAAILDLKMQRGTFGAMIGTQRLYPSHIEILRGLLADDSRQRWTAEDMEQWQKGRRMTLKSSDAGKRATRLLEFMGKEYWQMAPLANALAKNIGEAAKAIEALSIDKWLRRALDDQERADELDKIIGALKQSGKSSHYEDQLVTRTCIVLDPAGPIRYRGLSMMPAGIPSLLVEAMTNGTHAPVLGEIIGTQLVSLWIDQQKDGRGDHVATMQTFERMKTLIDKASLGNGIERVTYELNPGLYCLSPMLRNAYAINAKMLLPALEKVAGGANRPREPMDRHIAAFLIVRDKRSEPFFEQIRNPEGSIARAVGMLALFAELQYRHGPPNLPQLAAWLAPFVEPALRRFLSKTLREELKKQVKDVVDTGNLAALLRLVDDPKRRDRDRQDFIAARLLYLNTQKEIGTLEAKIKNRDRVVQDSGKPMAATISSFLAIILICAAVIRAFWEALTQ